MSKRSIEELKIQLNNIRDSKIKEKKLFLTLDEWRYKRFIAGVVLSNTKSESIEETYKTTINKIVDDFISSIDYYDLTEADISSIVDIFDDIL